MLGVMSLGTDSEAYTSDGCRLPAGPGSGRRGRSVELGIKLPLATRPGQPTVNRAQAARSPGLVTGPALAPALTEPWPAAAPAAVRKHSPAAARGASTAGPAARRQHLVTEHSLRPRAASESDAPSQCSEPRFRRRGRHESRSSAIEVDHRRVTTTELPRPAAPAGRRDRVAAAGPGRRSEGPGRAALVGLAV